MGRIGEFLKLVVQIILVVLVCSSISGLMLGVKVLMDFIKTILGLVLLAIMVIVIVIKLVDYFED